MIKIIIAIFALFIAQCTSCHNQTECLLENSETDLLEESENCSADKGEFIKYILYTPDAKREIYSNSVITNTKPVKVILAGLNADGETDVINLIIMKYFKVHGPKYHIIVPDYKIYFYDLAFYCNVTSITIGVSTFLHNLVLTNGMNSENIHIIGSSLGAQLAGVVGSFFKQLSNQTIGRITGLDPAGLGFSCPSFPKCRLDKISATFVDVMITTIDIYNPLIKNGHTDFIVNNGGPVQPGCEISEWDDPVFCSHLRSNFLFAESIDLNNFRGYCLLNCSNINNTIEEEVYMGEYCTTQPKCGAYKVVTKRNSPFGLDYRG